MRKRNDKSSRDESGAAAVEFALVFPIFLAVVIGIVTFGFLFAQQLALGNGARQAARWSVVDVAGRDCDAIVGEAKANSNSLGMTGTNATVRVLKNNVSFCTGGTARPCAGSNFGDNITVEVTYNSPLIISVPYLPSTKTLMGKGTFQCEYK